MSLSMGRRRDVVVSHGGCGRWSARDDPISGIGADDSGTGRSARERSGCSDLLFDRTFGTAQVYGKILAEALLDRLRGPDVAPDSRSATECAWQGVRRRLEAAGACDRRGADRLAALAPDEQEMSGPFGGLPIVGRRAALPAADAGHLLQPVHVLIDDVLEGLLCRRGRVFWRGRSHGHAPGLAHEGTRPTSGGLYCAPFRHFRQVPEVRG